MPNRYLVTGCAGFIGSKVAELLVSAGHSVVGVDNVNDAYDPRLKEWRLARLEPEASFRFHRLDLADRSALEALFVPGPGRIPYPVPIPFPVSGNHTVRPDECQ